jgi:hypothetical protein
MAGAIVWVAAAAARPVSAPQHAMNCSTWMDDSIVAGKNRTENVAKYSEPIGDSLVATFPDSARIQVVTATHAPNGDPLTVGLLLNTTLARPGKGTLTINGENAQCAGFVYVGTPPPR